MNKVAICTVSSANYFAFAKTFLKSVEEVHPEFDRFYLLVDKVHEQIVAEKGFTTLRLEELGIENFARMAFVYDIVELNTAVKPFLFSYLLNKGYQKVIFFDPDIYLYDRLDYVLGVLERYSIALTPHSIHPAERATSHLSRIEHEKNMSTTGIFNLGFIGISNRPDTYEFLSWWQNRCWYLCFVDPSAGIFVDQKWAELAIVYWKDVFIVRDPGYNVSIWNLHGRSVNNNLVNQTNKLVFYHFSGIQIHDASILSKNERSVHTDDHPELLDLFAKYRKAVIDNGYDYYKQVPYAFNCFADGKKIDLLERRLFGMVAEQFKDPFASSKEEFYRMLKRYAKSVEQENKGLAFHALSMAAKWLFKLIGPQNYRNMAMYFGKSAQLRAHTFLLR